MSLLFCFRTKKFQALLLYSVHMNPRFSFFVFYISIPIYITPSISFIVNHGLDIIFFCCFVGRIKSPSALSKPEVFFFFFFFPLSILSYTTPTVCLRLQRKLYSHRTVRITLKKVILSFDLSSSD